MVTREEEFYDSAGDMILPNGVKQVRILGPFEGSKKHVLTEECPNGEYYAEILNLQSTSWNSQKWEEVESWLQENGFETLLKKRSGTSKTRSGTAQSAKTSLYFW